MSKKTTISIISIIGLALIVSGVYAKLKTINQESEDYYSYEKYQQQGQELEDPWQKNILGSTLNYPILRDLVGTEIGLDEWQKAELANIVKQEIASVRILQHSNVYSEEEIKLAHAFLEKGFDDKIKQIFSPMQYARLRDWVIEQYTLVHNNYLKTVAEQNRMQGFYDDAERIEANLRENEEPVMQHWLGFMQSKLNLSENKIEELNQLLYNRKQEIFPLKMKLVQVIADQHNSFAKVQEEGKKIIKQIEPKMKQLESDLLKSLPSSKRKLYQFYMQIPEKG